jgi:uncharacterized protein YkwD
MADLAGNIMRRAKAIAVGSRASTYRDRIGGTDSKDFFKFNLKSHSSLTARLGALKGNANLELFQDRNQNGRVDPGELIASSRAPGRRAESIQIVGLDRGTYFLRVTPNPGNKTTYSLTTSAKPTQATSFAYRVVQLTNQYRQQNGLLPLAVNTQLSQAAQNYSKTMATQDFFDHVGLDGSMPWDRMEAAGYPYTRAAENIAAGQITPAEVVQAWIDSPGHRANILTPDLQEIGVGYFNLANDTGNINYNRYWTQLLGTPA